mmetsp:Transcript_68228/g.99822  ORF Transcript_68228/g.99822 Transcript_68228/m.99822 type:complete len:203 (-) Transcript_68228:1147-1755(-)
MSREPVVGARIPAAAPIFADAVRTRARAGLTFGPMHGASLFMVVDCYRVARRPRVMFLVAPMAVVANAQVLVLSRAPTPRKIVLAAIASHHELIHGTSLIRAPHIHVCQCLDWVLVDGFARCCALLVCCAVIGNTGVGIILRASAPGLAIEPPETLTEQRRTTRITLAMIEHLFKLPIVDMIRHQIRHLPGVGQIRVHFGGI